MNPVSRDTYVVTTLANERPTKLVPVCVLREPVRFARDCVAIVVLMTSATNVLAQFAKHPCPGDSEAAVPALKYESAFSDYQPFREQKGSSWKQVNKEVADNPGMGSMSSMKDMSGKAMSGMDSRSAVDAMSEEGHESMSRDKPSTAVRSTSLQTTDITGTGVVQVIDKTNGKVKLSHDPIEALGWPKMIMFFRLKDSALADQIKEGDTVEFSLEKSASGYVISGWHKAAAGHDKNKMK